jgi:hypothetical protein
MNYHFDLHIIFPLHGKNLDLQVEVTTYKYWQASIYLVLYEYADLV